MRGKFERGVHTYIHDVYEQGFLNFPVSPIFKDNGRVSVTKMFDRLTQAGNYSLSVKVVMSSGEVSYTNNLRFTIPRQPITLSFGFLPYSVFLGETFEVEADVKNNAGVFCKGNISLEWYTTNSKEKFDTVNQTKLIEIEKYTKKSFLFKVTPTQVGDMQFVLKSREFLRVVVKGSTKVLPYGIVKTFVSKSFLMHNRKIETDINKTAYLKKEDMIKRVPVGCEIHSSNVTKEFFHLQRNFDIIDNDNKTSSKLTILRDIIRSRNIDQSFENKCDDNKTASSNTNNNNIIIDTAFKLIGLIELQKSLSENQLLSYDDDAFVIFLGLTANLQDGPKENVYQNKKQRSEDSNPTEQYNKTVENPVFFELKKYIVEDKGHFNMSGFIEHVITSGVQFHLNDSIFANHSNETSFMRDNLSRSILALLFSTRSLNQEAEMVLKILEVQSSKDESGIFWTSKWNSVDTCHGQSSDLKPSLSTTAFALSAYVKMKKDGAEQIANWLFTKYSTTNEFKSFYEDGEVAKALDCFADYSESINGERPLVYTQSLEYICPFENTIGDFNFTLQVMLLLHLSLINLLLLGLDIIH